MANARAFSPHVRWTRSEVAILLTHYPAATHQQLGVMLPGRSMSQIQNKANGLGIVRIVKPARTADETRKAKRELMARRRAENPEEFRAYHRERHHKRHEENKAKLRAYSAKRFFWSRAMKLRGENRATFRELAALWKSQRGLCALTGRRLDRFAQLDHIKPKARGGGDDLANLRWVCIAANLAKRDLSDDEFFQLCADVVRRIAEQAKAAE